MKPVYGKRMLTTLFPQFNSSQAISGRATSAAPVLVYSWPSNVSNLLTISGYSNQSRSPALALFKMVGWHITIQ